MEQIKSTQRFAYLAAMLVLSMAGGIAAGLIVTAARAMGVADPEVKAGLKEIILYAGISLIITLPLLLWTFSKWLRLRATLLRQAASTDSLPNAWSEAGKRITAPDPDELEEEEPPAI